MKQIIMPSCFLSSLRLVIHVLRYTGRWFDDKMNVSLVRCSSKQNIFVQQRLTKISRWSISLNINYCRVSILISNPKHAVWGIGRNSRNRSSKPLVLLQEILLNNQNMLKNFIYNCLKDKNKQIYLQ